MKKLATVVAAIALIGTPAFAADMAVKAPPPTPAPVPYTWTGFYVGGNIGGAWTRNGQSEGQLFAGPGLAVSPLLPFDTNGTNAIGGLQIGYNWQFVPQWVVGIEGDWSWTNLTGSQTYSPIPPGAAGVATAPSFMTMGRNVDWLSSVRGRFGYAWGPTLLYVTGGAAWSRTNFFGIESRVGGALGEQASFDSIKPGWVAGGGLEYMLSNNVSARVQYLYYSFQGTSTIVPGVFTVFDTFSWGRERVNSMTGGLNYQFH
jgi:outer membrane immunogenic protein